MAIRGVCVALCALLLALSASADDVISISVRGISDANRDGAQQDRLEAIMDAKRQACEKAGVTITSKTTVENFKIAFDYVESQAQAVLLPGFQVMDVGYMEDGTFAVVIVGSVRKVSAVPSGKSLFTLIVWFTDQGADITGKDALLDKLYAWMTRFGASLSAAGAALDTYEDALTKVAIADSAASSGKRYYAFTYSLSPGDIVFAQKLQNTDGGRPRTIRASNCAQASSMS